MTKVKILSNNQIDFVSKLYTYDTFLALYLLVDAKGKKAKRTKIEVLWVIAFILDHAWAFSGMLPSSAPCGTYDLAAKIYL